MRLLTEDAGVKGCIAARVNTPVRILARRLFVYETPAINNSRSLTLGELEALVPRLHATIEQAEGALTVIR